MVARVRWSRGVQRFWLTSTLIVVAILVLPSVLRPTSGLEGVLPRAAAASGSPALGIPPAPLNMVSYHAGTPFSGGGYGVAFDPLHQTFDVASTTRGLQVVREGTWTYAGNVSLSLGNYCRVVVDGGRQLAFVSGGTATGISIVNTTTLTVTGSIPTSGGAEGMALDPGRALLVYTDGTGVSFYNYVTSTHLAAVAVGTPTRVALDPVHQVVAASQPTTPGVVWLINETTHRWFGNVSVVPSILPLTFVPATDQFVAGSNGNNQWSTLSPATLGRSTNSTISLMTNLQDMAPVGGGTSEVLVWGNNRLSVVAANNMSVLQSIAIPGGGSFPYGIAVDPSTEVALGVDPAASQDTPFLTSVSTVPSPPAFVSLRGGNNSASVTWSASVAYRITNYSIEYGSSAATLTRTISTGSSSPSTVSLSWPDGSPVYAAVTAWNGSVSSGPSSPAVETIPVGIPFPPQNVSASAQGATVIGLQWSLPRSNDGSVITAFRVGWRDETSPTWTYEVLGATADHATLGNLTTGDTYNLNVSARNSVGYGNSSGVVTVVLSAPPTSTLADWLVTFEGLTVMALILLAVLAVTVILLVRRRKGRMRGGALGAPPSATGWGPSSQFPYSSQGPQPYPEPPPPYPAPPSYLPPHPP
ncbi:MAG: fibronectin type III domain-containing protein [Euryarchaeota archaeon]|nr:fibronectin type III domain-containing protein [Euryarchaeota archaeon]MDE2046279.1 fibronectin type III domain-containing protein [Thermoplasmata archaeon]